MAELSRIANVTIRLGTLAIREKSFDSMMIFGPHAVDLARTMIITDSDQLLDAGIDESDPLYVAAADAFSQTPAIDQVTIGRQQVDALDVVVDVASNNTDYTIDFTWLDATETVQNAQANITSSGSATESSIATALTTAINGLANFVGTATSSGSSITITLDTQGTQWTVDPGPNMHIDQGSYVVNESIADGLAATESDAGFWYGLILTSREQVDVRAAMDWVEANEKLFVTASNDPAILQSVDTNSIAYYAQSNNYMRTAVMYQSKADTQYPDAALMSDRFTYYPGAATWANVRLSGVFADSLPEGDYVVAKSKNVTTFEVFRNFSMTQGGKVAGNEWIDIIRLRDALVEAIKVSIVGAIVRATNSTGKLPFTDGGIQVIGNAIRGPLDLNVARGGISPPTLDENDDVIPSYTVTLPRAVNISDNDKANRLLQDVYFTARLAGAIHFVEVQGSLVYSF